MAPPIPIGAEIKPEIKPSIILGAKPKFGLSLAVFSLIFKRYAPKKYTTIVKNNKSDLVFKVAAKSYLSKLLKLQKIHNFLLLWHQQIYVFYELIQIQ